MYAIEISDTTVVRYSGTPSNLGVVLVLDGTRTFTDMTFHPTMPLQKEKYLPKYWLHDLWLKIKRKLKITTVEE